MRSLVLAVALAGVATATDAATLRTFTLLHGPDVLLSDLFEDAGNNASRRLGPGPAPGARIVVEAAQLAAIARQFGVDWRPASKGDRAVLERPGRALPEGIVTNAVKAALTEAGSSDDIDIELTGFVAPMIPPDADVRAAVTQMDFDRGVGRFSAMLMLTGEGMEPQAVRIAGHAEDTVEVPVAVLRLSAGAVLRPEDVRMARVRVSLTHGDIARRAAEAVGMQARHLIQAGAPLMLADLVRPALVQRGAHVQMMLENGGLLVSGQGIAMDNGAAGDRVRVLNPVSRAVLEAVVTEAGRVRVAPGSMPITTAQGPQVLPR